MKKILFYLPALVLVMIIVGSCEEECDDCKDMGPDIYGTWTVLQFDDIGQQYNVELTINTNNTFDWIIVDSVTGHSNSHASFSLSGYIMTIINDPDCNSKGQYYLSLNSGKLAIIAQYDECGPRAAGLEWVWKRK